MYYKIEQFTMQTTSSLNNLDLNSLHVSSMYITPRTPNNIFQLLIFYTRCFLFYYSTMNFNQKLCYFWTGRGGANKSLARPGRKQNTATKLGIYSTYSTRSWIHFLARCSNFCKSLKKGQIRRIGWVIKTLEAQVGQFLLGCKFPVSRGIVVQEQDYGLISTPSYAHIEWNDWFTVCRLRSGEL
jgi:hypothetical protein